MLEKKDEIPIEDESSPMLQQVNIRLVFRKVRLLFIEIANNMIECTWKGVLFPFYAQPHLPSSVLSPQAIDCLADPLSWTRHP
jgi:hypothetical protein